MIGGRRRSQRRVAMHAEGLPQSTSAQTRVTMERAVLDLRYLATGLGTAVLALALWITAVTLSLSLAVFVVGLPVMLVSARAFRLLAEVDRRNAALVLGAPLRGRYRDHGGDAFLARLSATLKDPQTWKDLQWLVVHSVVGLAFGCAAISLVAQLAGLATLPLWFWAPPGGLDWWGLSGVWQVDTLWEALLVAPFAIPLAVITVVLLRVMARGEAGLASALLGEPGEPVAAAAGATADATPAPAHDHGRALPLHVALAALAGFACSLVWGLTTRGYFWPVWVWLGLAISVALHALAASALRAEGDPIRSFRVCVDLCVVIAVVCVVVWALAGGGYLWPVWPILGMSLGLAARALFVYRHRLPWVREQELVERVDQLTRTRRGALDVQDSELRRIERDLHDGAQARLVALSMQLGRAEARLSDQPELAELVRQARDEASAAIGELRDLARGIAPPILVARGIAAAVDALGRRVATAVTVDAHVDRRPPAVIETAAYFVVAESLTNVAKHTGDARARVELRLDADLLVVEVSDDGPGGADPQGGGLTGLRHRVEALDGTLQVTSPPGGPTTIRAELPCGS
jgi:signal transduction histidine kinase